MILQSMTVPVIFAGWIRFTTAGCDRKEAVMEQSVSSRIEEYKDRSDLRESSIELLDRAVRWFIGLCGDMDPKDIQYAHIDDYKKWLSKGRKNKSANTYLSIIKPFFKWLDKRRYIERDPFDGVKLYAVVDRKFEIYKNNEIERMLKVANHLWTTIICLALSGMREAEILNLVLSDVDFEKNMILITPKKDTSYTWKWDIKDHNQAYIGIDESVTKLLIESSERLQGTQMPYLNLKEKYWERNLRLRKEGKLRHRLRNCPWGNFTRDFKALLKRAQVKEKRFHDLRGTFATERYKDGYTLKELQYLLRHSSIQTTANYIQNIEEQKLVAKSGQTFKKYYATKVP